MKDYIEEFWTEEDVQNRLWHFESKAIYRSMTEEELREWDLLQERLCMWQNEELHNYGTKQAEQAALCC